MTWLQELLSWDWMKILGSLGLAGILAGFTNSITAHWLGRRKDRTAYRRGKLQEWREAVSSIAWPSLGDTAAYADLRRYMDEKVVADIENPRLIIVQGGRGTDPIKQRLMDEIARIERGWGLI